MDYKHHQGFNKSLRVIQKLYFVLCKQMKQTLGIILAVVYALLIIGVPISVNHCEKLQDDGIVMNEEASCCCTIIGSEETDCQSKPHTLNDNTINSCCTPDPVNEKGCCTTEEEIIKWNPDQQLFTDSKISFKINHLDLLTNFNIAFLDFCKPKVNTVFLDLPPPQTKSTQILQHQFTFYG